MTILPELFAAAGEATDAAYFEVERAIVEQGSTAARFLRAVAFEEVDRLRRFIAIALADLIEGAGPLLAEAMRSIDAYHEGIRESPAGSARPDVAADLMTAVAGDRITTAVALRLLKDRSWPPWKVRAALSYLERHPNPIVRPALTRVAERSVNPAIRRIALAVLEQLPVSPIEPT